MFILPKRFHSIYLRKKIYQIALLIDWGVLENFFLRLEVPTHLSYYTYYERNLHLCNYSRFVVLPSLGW